MVPAAVGGGGLEERKLINFYLRILFDHWCRAPGRRRSFHWTFPPFSLSLSSLSLPLFWLLIPTEWTLELGKLRRTGQMAIDFRCSNRSGATVSKPADPAHHSTTSTGFFGTRLHFYFTIVPTCFQTPCPPLRISPPASPLRSLSGPVFYFFSYGNFPDCLGHHRGGVGKRGKKGADEGKLKLG